MFVTTANTLNIPAPLMDRMEIIRIAGYTEDEKVEIARKHLIPAAVHEARSVAEGVERSTTSALLDAHPPLHARGGRAQPGARDLPTSPARR